MIPWLEPYMRRTNRAVKPAPLSEDEKDFLSERAAIIEIDAGLPREEAERLAWQCLLKLRKIGESP